MPEHWLNNHMASDDRYRNQSGDQPGCWCPPVPPPHQHKRSEQEHRQKRERYRHRQHGWSDHKAWQFGHIGDADYAFLLVSVYVTGFNQDGRPMVELSWQNQSVTLSIGDSRLTAIIDELFWAHTNTHLTSAGRHSALRLLTNQAVMAPPRLMGLRTALTDDGKVGIDIGLGRVVTFGGGGFEIAHDFPITFRAAPPLPTPTGVPNLMRLRDYINVDDDGFQLIVAWLTFSLLPFGPYPSCI